ncbi:uncharacterized protein HD556DRAFT_1327705 [Suillus plorans]|uniref:RecQ-mediated genome instability protein 1 n=1 Tax=Suillus plorans TaxID=116603 RepID=A0A9P7DWM2_9AGAM|nr:uncharacterized protein HD556DRAFT_1327705 [Suillus plorans]KAG1804983.1 hypothetical protein HD556DRAFT_1327705 [Suillus plorans]
MTEPAAPANILKWVNEQYPRPALDPVWLRDCCSWIASSYSLSPTDFPQFSSHVTSQFLQSSFADSTLPNTGLPQNIRTIKRARLTGHPCLVEIRAISDIGISAFSLMNVRQNRMDRADLAGLVREDEEDAEEDEGPVPKYPRGMLRLELSDGFTTVEAVEYRAIPQLELGVTPLGYKILLKDVHIRRGVIFLEPQTIELKGHQTEDHEVMQDEIFLRSLRRRLGQPDPEPNPQPPGEAEAPPQAPPLPSVPSPPIANRRLVGNPPEGSTSTNAATPAVRLKALSTAAQKTSLARAASKSNSIPPSTSSTLVSSSKPTSSLKPPSAPGNLASTTSPYFSTSSTLYTSVPSSSTSDRSNPRDNPSAPLARARILSPAPRDATWSLDDEEFEAFITEVGSAPISPPKPISKLPSKRNVPSAKPASPPRAPSPPSDYDLDLMDLDIDDELIAQAEKIEAEALATVSKSPGTKGLGSDIRDMRQMNASRATGPRHQGAQGMTTVSGSSRPSAIPAVSTTTSRPRIGPASVQRQPTSSTRRRVPGPASARRQYTASTLQQDVIDVESDDSMYVDDSDDGKENVPTRTRVVVDEDIIVISD